MPNLTFPKSALGAIIDVSLLPSTAQRLRHSGRSVVAAPCMLKLLIDTGADHTAVCLSKIAPWGLNRASFYWSQSMGGAHLVDVYDLALTIGASHTAVRWNLDPLLVTARSGFPFDGLPYNGVLGRDVLDRGLFIYNGLSNHCTLAY